MARRPLQEINAGSMADIAFLLLIFFLVTTTMDQDIGILRQLPPPIPEDQPPPPKVIERNVYEVLVNRNNQLLVEKAPMDIRNLKEGAREFLTNPTNRADLPEMRSVDINTVNSNIARLEAALAQEPDNSEFEQQLEDQQDKLLALELIGPYRELPTSALISLQNDRGTSYNTYIQVQNELQAAVNELRDELSLEKFNVRYSALNPADEEDKPKIIAIRAVYPQRISEAEPKDYGGL